MLGISEPAGFFGRSKTKLGQKRTQSIAVALLAFLPAACAGMPPSAYPGPAPSDPAAPVAKTTFSSPVASYVALRPVSPTQWQPQNERDALSPKTQQ